MILLTGSSTLRVYLGAPASTNELPIVATYIDSNSSNFTPQASETITDGVTPVTVVYAPISGLSRQIKYLSILNTDTTTNEVFIDYRTATDDRRLFKQSLTPNQKIEFVDSQGFGVIPESFLTVTGNVTGLPFITYQSSALLYNHRVSAARSGIQVIDAGTNAGSYSFGLSGNMYHDITGHTGDLTQHITGLSISNQLLDQTIVWNTTGWINKYAHSVVYATNGEATTLDIGEVVYLSGAQGDRATVRRASNNYEATSSKTVGLVSTAITSNNSGPIVTLGYVEKLNLGAYTEGDVLWLGDTPGTFTKTKPSAPNHLVFIGVVARANAGNGIAFVKTQNGYELEELHNVAINSGVGGIGSGQFLMYSTGIWVNTGIYTGNISGFTTGVKTAIGSSGFFEYRGGITGYWDSTGAKLILNLFSGAGGGGAATQLSDLTDVADTLTPAAGHVLYYTTEWDSIMANENFVMSLAPSPTGASLVGLISLTGVEGLNIRGDYGNNRIIISGEKSSITASLTGLGVAGFNSTNFAVSNGIATLTGGVQTGYIVNLVPAIQNTVGSSIGFINLTGVLASGSVSGDYLVFNGTGWTGSPTIKQILQSTKTPNGYENRAESTLAFDEGTRTFSITPVGSSFSFWNSGKRYTKTTSQTVTIPDASGLYYFYFDIGGNLTYKTTYFDFANDVHTSYVYWNPQHDRAYYFADERHGVTMDWQTHLYLHRTRGAAYANGFGASNYTLIGGGTSDTDCQIDIANGSFFDEDIEVAITHSASPASNSWEQVLQGPAEIPIFYLSGAGLWIKDPASEFPVKQGTHTAQYNILSGAIWTGVDLSGLAANQTGYGITWIIATNNLNSPVLGILGQSLYTGLGAAEAANWTDVSLPGFPIFEFRPLYKVIYEAYSGFSNTPRARFRSLIDLRLTQSVANGTPAIPVSDHGSLVGLADDDHIQYTRVDGTRAFTSVIAGVNPIGLSDLATRDFVENRTQWASTAVSGISWYDGNFFTVTDGYVSLNAIYITDLSDTAVVNPISGEVFVFDGFVWRNSGLTTGNITLLAECIRDEASSAITGISGIIRDYNDAGDSIRLSGVKATTAMPGIAAFSPTYFSVTDALVTITGGIQGSQVSNLTINTGQITNLIEAIVDETYLALRSTSGLSIKYDDTNGIITLSGERANYNQIGLAAFNSSHFTVNSGHVSLAVPVVAATESVAGIIEIASNTEAGDATATNVALVPSNISSIKTSALNNDAGFIADITAGLLDDLSDVTEVSSVSTQFLMRGTGLWTNSYVPTGSVTNLRTAVKNEIGTSGQFFLYRGGLTGIWDNTNKILTLSVMSGSWPGAGGSSNLDSLTDVTISSASAGEYLAYDGTNWINSGIQSGRASWNASGLQGKPIQSLSTVAFGDMLLYSYPAGDGWTNYPATDFAKIAIFNATGLNNLPVTFGAAPLTGQVLAHNGDRWVNSDILTGNIVNLRNAIKDEIGVSGQFFQYRGGITGYWNSATETLTLDYFSGASAGTGTLDNLTDVTIATPTSGQVIQYNGTEWRNENSWNIKIKTSRETKAIITTNAVDRDLWVPMAANTKYMFRGKIFYITDATPDFKYSFTGTTGSEWWVSRRNILPESTGISNAAIEHYPWGQAFNPGMGGVAGTKTVAAAGNSGAGLIEFDAVVLNSGNTGVFGFTWAQNTSNASPAAVNEGSYIEWRVFT